MPNAEKLAKKNAYFAKVIDLCVNTPQALIVSVDHVRSKQMQDIRIALRGRAIVVMGKNTQIRKALQQGAEEHPDAGMDNIRPLIKGNLGFIFATNCTLDDIKSVMQEFRLPASAKVNQTSICDMSIPAGPTGMDPSQTALFQALNIGTKIVKGQIELTSEYQILKIGEKVSPGAAIMLQKLNIRPFEYGMEVVYVKQEANVFPAAVLDMSEATLISKFLAGVANMAAFSREVGIPTEAGMPHMFGNAFRNVAALCSSLDFTFKEIEDVKKFIETPEAFASAAGPATGGGGGDAAKGPAKAAAVEEEEEEEVDFDLFG